MSVTEPREAPPFTRWQWLEIWVLVVVIAVVIAAQLLLGSLLLAAVFLVVQGVLLVHIATWLVPRLVAKSAFTRRR